MSNQPNFEELNWKQNKKNDSSQLTKLELED
jgi:hypothetical protein